MRILAVGSATGVLLGVLLVLLQQGTGYPLDRILLDLSYVPVLQDYNVFIVQWLAHLVIAVLVAAGYQVVYRVIHQRSKRAFGYLGGLAVGLLTAQVYWVILPHVAPELHGVAAPFLYWLLAHAIYGVALHQWLIRKTVSAK